MRPQVVDARLELEVILLAARKKLDHMPQVSEFIVDRRGRKHVNALIADNVEQAPVTRRFDLAGAANQTGWEGRVRGVLADNAARTDVAEVVCLVDDHGVGALACKIETLGDLAAPQQIGVHEDFQPAECTAPQMRQMFLKDRFPDTLPCPLRHHQQDIFPLVQHQPLD